MQLLNQFGTTFRGTLGKAMTAATWMGRNYIRGYRKPANPKTTQQVVMRDIFTDAVEEWHDLEPEQKLAYHISRAVKEVKITDFNGLMKSYVGMTKAGLTYEPPAYGFIFIADSVTGVGIEGARCIVRYRDTKQEIWSGYTNVNGHILKSSFCIEDEPYYFAVIKTGYEPIFILSLTAAEIIATHEMTPEA